MAKVLLSVGDLPGARRARPLESTYADALQQLRTRSARRLPEECLERTQLALALDGDWCELLGERAREWNAGKVNRVYRRTVVESAIRASLAPEGAEVVRLPVSRVRPAAAPALAVAVASAATAGNGKGERRRRIWPGAVLLAVAAAAILGGLWVLQGGDTAGETRAPETHGATSWTQMMTEQPAISQLKLDMEPKAAVSDGVELNSLLWVVGVGTSTTAFASHGAFGRGVDEPKYGLYGLDLQYIRSWKSLWAVGDHGTIARAEDVSFVSGGAMDGAPQWERERSGVTEGLRGIVCLTMNMSDTWKCAVGELAPTLVNYHDVGRRVLLREAPACDVEAEHAVANRVVEHIGVCS